MGYLLGIGVGFVAALVLLLAREYLRERRPVPRQVCGWALSVGSSTLKPSTGSDEPVRCTREHGHEMPHCTVMGGTEIWWRAERKD